MDDKSWIPEGIALDRPNPARIYDYNLGGYHNFEIDRLIAKQMNAVCPDMALNAHANRAFLRRVVQFLGAQGVDQFLDIGSGLPTRGNVHEVAQGVNPKAHVVYVDIDPIAVAHSTAILAGNPNAAAIQADARQPEHILDRAVVKRLLDLSRPVGVLFLAILHLIVDDQQAYRAVHTIRDVLAPGSFVAISHFSHDGAARDVVERMQQLGARSVSYRARSRDEVSPFFEGLEWVEPGLVRLPLWRPEGPDDVFLERPERVLGWAGVGRKPSADSSLCSE